jgi:hypothetical protein
LKLEILNAQQESLVTILSDSTLLKSTVEEVEDMNLSTTFRYVNKKLNSKKGLNRFGWDLRKKGAWSKNEKRRYRNGPIVAPGAYTVKLTAGNQTFSQNFEILLDPRVKEEGITQEIIEKQAQMQTKVLALLSEARMFQDQLEKEVKSLKNKKDRKSKKRLAKLNTALQQLKNNKGAYPQQMLVAQISYLYNMTNGPDQVIGKDMVDRYAELSQALSKIKTSLN